jgi:hypothetical protein
MEEAVKLVRVVNVKVIPPVVTAVEEVLADQAEEEINSIQKQTC